jgi:hypothetical protein
MVLVLALALVLVAGQVENTSNEHDFFQRAMTIFFLMRVVLSSASLLSARRLARKNLSIGDTNSVTDKNEKFQQSSRLSSC